MASYSMMATVLIICVSMFFSVAESRVRNDKRFDSSVLAATSYFNANPDEAYDLKKRFDSSMLASSAYFNGKNADEKYDFRKRHMMNAGARSRIDRNRGKHNLHKRRPLYRHQHGKRFDAAALVQMRPMKANERVVEFYDF